MRTEDSMINKYGGDYPGSLNGGSKALLQLEDRVSQYLKLNDSSFGTLSGDPIDPQKVKSYMAQISQTPLPGMSQNFIV